jgi:hypothetical protein
VLRCVAEYLRGVRPPLDLLKQVEHDSLQPRQATG